MVDRFRFELVAMFGYKHLAKIFLDNVRYLDARATVRVSKFRVPEMHVHEHIAVFVTIAVAFRHPGWWWWQNRISRARQIKGRHANCLGGPGIVKDSYGTSLSFIVLLLILSRGRGGGRGPWQKQTIGVGALDCFVLRGQRRLVGRGFASL